MESVSMTERFKALAGRDNELKRNEPRHEKTGFLHMPKQRRRSASR